jgi:antirestriction protein ArdC
MQATDLFEIITAQLIADIEAGTDTWRMPLHRLADIGSPVSADGRPYRTGTVGYSNAADCRC